jgi:hypothetical protein
MKRIVRATFVALLSSLFWTQLASAQQSANVSNPPPFKDIGALVRHVQSRSKAPFHRDGAQLPKGAAAELLQHLARAAASTARGQNVKVNRDRNPWPKAEIGAAVDPTNGNNYVVMTNDFRENYDHMFYHVSSNGGLSFTDDSMVGGADPVTGFIPLTFQSDPGVAFDTRGHSVLSTITGNLIFDFGNDYLNNDTEIETVVGYGHGAYTLLLPTPIDDQPCNGTFTGAFNCPAQLDKPLITIDNVAGSPNNGAVYVYYTLFCLGAGATGNQPCKDGNAVVPAGSSAILVASSPGAGLAFGPPKKASGSFHNAQFSDLVVDSHGTPHIFFDDFSDPLFVRMYESTLTAGAWAVKPTPVATFIFRGLASINWGFRINGTVAPGCGIDGDTAYCAFSANQIKDGHPESGASVYVAVVDTFSGASTIHRVNNDPFNDGKDHFFPWATAKSDGSVYVGWYDDRNDPFNTKVEYFVGKSTDRGKTFSTQAAVSDVPFNPCTGFPGCNFFGDYTQLVSGPDGVVRAAWSDTRDGASMQVWSQAVTW